MTDFKEIADKLSEEDRKLLGEWAWEDAFMDVDCIQIMYALAKSKKPMTAQEIADELNRINKKVKK